MVQEICNFHKRKMVQVIKKQRKFQIWHFDYFMGIKVSSCGIVTLKSGNQLVWHWDTEYLIENNTNYISDNKIAP